MYQVKEIFYTLQGEGRHTGRAAVFCRFSGCNLWSGQDSHRTSSICYFCDTDFIGTDGPGGGRFSSAQALVDAILGTWPDKHSPCFVVFTGGEPLLQLDKALIDKLRQHKAEIAVETNGTIKNPENIDWICVSPKGDSKLAITKGQELKFIYPQTELFPEQVEHLDFDYFYLQPMDGPEQLLNTQLAIKHCLDNPKWRLGLQTHKIAGFP